MCQSNKLTIFASLKIFISWFSAAIFFSCIFLPTFLIVYFIVPKSFRNITLLFFSIIFYAYGAPGFIIQFILSMVANFYIVRWINKTANPTIRKMLCGISIAISIGLLFFYKYGNFTMYNINAVLGWVHHEPLRWAKILLPIGISFFSFQSVTYTLDTYRHVNEPMDKLSDYMLYISMFPQLVAGPIIRYCDIAGQINE